MSLIEEALRRSKDPRSSNTATPSQQTAPAQPAPAHPWPATPPPQTQPTRAPSASKPVNVLTAAMALIIALAAAWLIGGMVWLSRHSPMPRAETPPPPSPAPRPTRASTSAPPAPAATPLSARPAVPSSSRPASRPPSAPPSASSPRTDYVLSGVVEGVGKPYAVINGTILAVGETLGDATLVEIANGAARLRHADGTESDLQIPR